MNQALTPIQVFSLEIWPILEYVVGFALLCYCAYRALSSEQKSTKSVFTYAIIVLVLFIPVTTGLYEVIGKLITTMVGTSNPSPLLISFFSDGWLGLVINLIYVAIAAVFANLLVNKTSDKTKTEDTKEEKAEKKDASKEEK